jgi:hypothetical protein
MLVKGIPSPRDNKNLYQSACIHLAASARKVSATVVITSQMAYPIVAQLAEE